MCSNPYTKVAALAKNNDQGMVVAGSAMPVARRNPIGYKAGVAIRSFRHKGLRRFFVTGTRSGIQVKHADRLRLILGRLNVAVEPWDMGLPGLALNPLKGQSQGRWAVTVSGNRRLTFAFEGHQAVGVDYEDYH